MVKLQICQCTINKYKVIYKYAQFIYAYTVCTHSSSQILEIPGLMVHSLLDAFGGDLLFIILFYCLPLFHLIIVLKYLFLTIWLFWQVFVDLLDNPSLRRNGAKSFRKCDKKSQEQQLLGQEMARVSAVLTFKNTLFNIPLDRYSIHSGSIYVYIYHPPCILINIIILNY